jgi:hypothetical protein
MPIVPPPRLARFLVAAHTMACLTVPPAQAAFSCGALDLKSATLRFGAAAGDDRLTVRGKFALALAAYQASRDAGEISAAATLNALPEVTSRLDPAGQATAAGGWLDVAVTLPPDGAMLLRFRRAQ